MTSDEREVCYEVMLDVEPDLRDAVLHELREQHVPSIWATGCFHTIRVECTDGGLIRTRYEAARKADLDRYLAEHTARVRAEFMARFPRGVRPSRETWQAVAEWRREQR